MKDLKYVPFYVDWYEMMQTKDTAEKQVAFVEAIFDYALNGSVPPPPKDLENPKGVDYARRDGYLLAKATLDFILPKIVAGIRGGSAGKGVSRNIGNQNARKNNSKNNSKTIASNNTLRLIKDKDKDKDKDNTGAGAPSDGKEILDRYFERWWESYPGPRKQDKKKCHEKFVKILSASKMGPDSMFLKIMEGLEVWKRCDTWTKDGGAYIRGPMVWLNNENWNDNPSSTSQSRSSGITNVLSCGVTKEDENVF